MKERKKESKWTLEEGSWGGGETTAADRWSLGGAKEHEMVWWDWEELGKATNACFIWCSTVSASVQHALKESVQKSLDHTYTCVKTSNGEFYQYKRLRVLCIKLGEKNNQKTHLSLHTHEPRKQTHSPLSITLTQSSTNLPWNDETCLILKKKNYKALALTNKSLFWQQFHVWFSRSSSYQTYENYSCKYRLMALIRSGRHIYTDGKTHK